MINVVPIVAGLRDFLYTREGLIFLLAFSVRIIAFVGLFWWFGILGNMPQVGADFPTLAGDSADYKNLTENLRHEGMFSSSLEQPLIPESFRLPGYPFFLYLFTFLPYSYVLAMIVQIALASLSCVLLYKIGKKFLSERVSFVGALLFCFEPTSVFYSTVVMSDTIFVFAMLFSIFLLFSPQKHLRAGILVMFLAGLLLGYAVLVRTIAQYLAGFLLLAFLVLFRKNLKPLKHTALKLGAFVLGMVIIMAPWAIRQHYWFNTYTLSSTPYINFTQYNLVYFYAWSHGISNQEAQRVFTDPIPYPEDSFWFRSLINEPIFKDLMRKGLDGNIVPYAAFHLTKTLPFFLNDSLRDINRMVGLFPPPKEVTNFTDLLLKKDFRAIVSFFTSPQPDLWMLIIGSSFWIVVSVLGIGATFYAVVRRRPRMWFLLFALGVVFYFGILSSPVIQPRYRMPAAPFMLLLASEAALGLYLFTQKKINRRSDI